MSRHVMPGEPAIPSSPVFVEGLGSGAGSLREPRPEIVTRQRPPASVEPGPSGRTATGSADPSLLLRHLAREAARALKVSRVGIWRFEDGTGGLRCLVRFDRGEGSLLEERLFSADLATGFRLALDRVTVVAVDDTRRSPGRSSVLEDWATSEAIRAVLILPVRVEGQLVGLVTFEEGRSPRSWTAQERELAAALAHQVRNALPTPGLSAATPAAPVSATPAVTPVLPATPQQRPTSSRTLLRRLPPLEGVAILTGERMDELLGILEVQRGSLALLEEAVRDSGADVDLVRDAWEAGHRVARGIRDFLDHLKNGIPRGEPTDLSRVIGSLVPSLAREAGDGLRLRIAPSAESLPVEVDPALLERALLHLVRNAREASKPGGDVRISWGLVPGGEKGASSSEPGMARIRVEDRGEGVSAEDLPWLFEPFFSNRKGDRPLQGIGLSVVQAIVEGYGGWVEVTSKVGTGTTVEMVFPLAVTAPEIQSEEDDAPRSEETTEGTAPARILILEDEPLLARLLERIFSRNGYVVEVASAPMDAERRWHRLGQGVDIVVAERTLAGGRSGVDPVKRWRKEAPGLQLVVLDRHAPPGSRGQTPDGEPILTRPFDPSDVLARVREMLAARRRITPEDEGSMPPGFGSSRSGGERLAH